MTNILVSNDDGIFAPGLKTLAHAMLELGDVTVVAPKENQSASGHRKTMYRPLRAVPTQGVFSDDIDAFAVDGAPSDCTALALMGLVDKEFDIVVAGINNGPNLGQDLTYSGTVSVVLEAAIFGVPGIAFSLDAREPDAHYDHCISFVQNITREVLSRGLPHQTILNVNFPQVSDEPLQGSKVTIQGRRIYRDILDTRTDPFGKPYYWIAGNEPRGDVDVEGTDIWAVHKNYVSITPVHLDLTRHAFLTTLRTWGFNDNSSGDTSDVLKKSDGENAE